MADTTRWPYELVGAGFGVLGLAFLLAGLHRARRVEQALERGGYAPLDPVLATVLVVAGAALGGLTVALLLLVR